MSLARPTNRYYYLSSRELRLRRYTSCSRLANKDKAFYPL
jgi:hypothetical protein